MKNVSTFFAFLSLGVFTSSLASSAAADWLTLPGRYSHDSLSGQRVAQYAPVEAPTLAAAQPLRSSGYTHYRSSMAYGQSADNYHQVEQWGDPVRPYGEWRFPYRPYSTPYPNWGAPYAGLNFNNNFLGGGFGGYPVGPIQGGPIHGGQPFPGGPHAPGTGSGMGGGMGPGMGMGPGGGVPPGGFPHDHGFGNEAHSQYHNGGRFPNPAADADGFAPYPSGRGTPYPVAPYYDGYHPNYRD